MHLARRLAVELLFGRQHATRLLDQRGACAHCSVEALRIRRFLELLLDLVELGGLRVELALKRVELLLRCVSGVSALFERPLEH